MPNRARQASRRDVRIPGGASAARWLLLAALAGALALASPASQGVHAQTPTVEQITAYTVDITVQKDGTLLVVENIDYFFPGESHGILRDIPVRQQYDDENDRIFPLEVVSVATTGGASNAYQLEDGGSGLQRIRIGDANRTVSGAHTYVITYRVRGALNAFPDHDELYWNAIGNQWRVPIGRPSVRVHTPAAPLEVACFAGPQGSNRACASAATEDAGATFSHRSLAPYEGMTVVISLPKGAVPEPKPLLEERWSLRKAFTISPLTLGLTGLLAAGAAYLIARLYWRTGRDLRWGTGSADALFGRTGDPERPMPLRDEGPVAAEYVPFEGMRPGLMGTLFDERANALDVTVTVIDLATRGYLRIEEIEQSGVMSWFAKPDWLLVRLKEPGDLVEYERTLFNALFESGDQVKLSDLKNKFAGDMAKVQQALYAEVVRRGWFTGSPDGTRNKWLAIAIVALAASIGLQYLSTRYTHFALVTTPLILGALVLLALHASMPRRTAAGTAALRHTHGFRRFIDDAEDERARFAEQSNLFYEYLPYAIVFGLAEKWAHAFEGLANPPQQPGWYVSSHPFTMAAFASSMDTFGTTATGTMTSTPGGSGGSGFGGGGFSGGGGGGGGGGSW
ncbi:MAG: DUF2207 domain-containing protein [Dehalococcoidia bacterium]